MRNFFTIVCCLLSFSYCFAQETDDELLDSLIDELLISQSDLVDELFLSLSNFDLIYTSINYNNNTYFSGRDIGFKQYNVVPQLTYVNSKGFYGGISGTYFSEFMPKWDVTVAFLGFGKALGNNKIVSYNIGFSKFFYANDEGDIYGNTADVGIALRSKNKKLGTQLVYTYLFGKEQSFQISSKNYVTLNLVEGIRSSLKIRPQLTIFFGKQTIESRRLVLINGVPTIIYLKNNISDFLNTQLKFPLQYSYNNLDFELGYTFNFPNPIGNETQIDSTNFFHFTFGYLIAL